MGAYLGKYHVAIDSKGYVISHNARGEKYYQKRKAPAFVNKFGSGDASYRDATFWQYWASTNWRNGAKQLRVDDGGKFWKSQNVNVTQLEELTLSRALTSIGQTAAGVEVNCLAAWRNSASWWNANYGYRQQITVTAPAGQQVPAAYPIKVTIDTAALQTAGKVRSDRNDWRIVYFNGSSWVDLTRDYVATNATFFPAQAAIAAGGSDNNYYVYYGYSGESTSKQPSTEADWNGIYGMFGTTPDANTIFLSHVREGSGSTLNDDGPNSYSGSLAGSPSWGTDGVLGRYITFASNSQYIDYGDIDVGSFTWEAWIYPTGLGNLFCKPLSNLSSVAIDAFLDNQSGDTAKIRIRINNPGVSDTTITSTGTVTYNTWQHVAITYDGSTTRIYKNGSEIGNGSQTTPPNTDKPFYVGIRKESGFSNYFPGRMQHIRLSNTARSSFPYVFSTEPSTNYGAETTTQPPASSFDLYAGCSNGKLYKWDGVSTFSEEFDARRLTWFSSGNDTDMKIGDEGGTERAQAQSFQLSAAAKIKGLELYLKKNAGTPGNITVRIETNNAGVPSGTLADANLTATITAFTTSTYGWVNVEFATVSAALSASTVYWIVVKIAAGANDNNYAWAADGSSPTYSSGNMASSADGGSSWSADTAKDAYFRMKGESTQINDLLVSSVGGTQKMLIATGDISSQVNGDARLFTYDGTNYSLEKTFATATESQITKLAEYSINGKLYAGVGPQARVYEGSSPSSWTLSKDINTPQNPGYVYALKEYNARLHAGGGSPEYLYDKNYNGFWFTFDNTTWGELYPFSFTVVKAFEFYDAFLFASTYRGDIFVFDTATLNPLFNFKDDYAFLQSVVAMQLYDDKIYFLLYPQTGSGDTNAAIWIFDRHGMSAAHTVSGVNGYRCAAVVNNLLIIGTGSDGYVYKLDLNTYVTQGWLQSSYFDAGLPSINKLYNSVTIQHDPLVSGQSIVVYYRFKESDSWTSLGTSNTVGAESTTLNFPSGTYSKKISLKVELNTSNTAVTPKVKEYVLQYTLYPSRKWLWTMRLYAKKKLTLLDRTLETRTADTIRTDLESSQNAFKLVTFVDIDGTSYNVLFSEIDQTSWVVNQGDVNEDEIVVTLLEA